MNIFESYLIFTSIFIVFIALLLALMYISKQISTLTHELSNLKLETTQMSQAQFNILSKGIDTVLSYNEKLCEYMEVLKSTTSDLAIKHENIDVIKNTITNILTKFENKEKETLESLIRKTSETDLNEIFNKLKKEKINNEYVEKQKQLTNDKKYIDDYVDYMTPQLFNLLKQIPDSNSETGIKFEDIVLQWTEGKGTYHEKTYTLEPTTIKNYLSKIKECVDKRDFNNIKRTLVGDYVFEQYCLNKNNN